MKWDTGVFVQRAKEVHGDTYDYSKVDYISALKKVSIICKEHGEFQQAPSKHLSSGHGCPMCGVQKCAKAIIVPFDDFVARARAKHGDKFQYIPSSYTGIRDKLKLVCPVHGEVEMTGVSHCISKTGCPKCRFVSQAQSKTITHEEFLEKSKELHGDRYDYSKTQYEHGKKYLTIICKKHGEFQQLGCKHLRGDGCRKCADEYTGNVLRKTTEQYIVEAKAVWGELYDYSLVKYINCHDKVQIICKIHGIVEKIAKDHISGRQGCQQCKPKKHSKLGIEWLNYMKVRDNCSIQHNENPERGGEHRIKNSLYHADGYCDETLTIYEFHGSYWHGDPKLYSPEKLNAHIGKSFGELYQNTLKKMEHCWENGYIVKECWENDWKKGVRAVKRLQKMFRRKRQEKNSF